MWQCVEGKAAGIEQFRKGDNLARVIEYVASEGANAAEMKAAATGKPICSTHFVRTTGMYYENFKLCKMIHRINLGGNHSARR